MVVEVEELGKPGVSKDGGTGKEATTPISFNFLGQRERFDGFMEIDSDDRPYQALNMKYPGELYTPSPRTFRVTHVSGMDPRRYRPSSGVARHSTATGIEL